MKEIIERYFAGLKGSTVGNLSYLVEGIMRSGTASVWHSAQAMASINNQSFRTNEKRGNRLLQEDFFQTDDAIFRKYINLLFDARCERNLLRIGDIVIPK